MADNEQPNVMSLTVTLLSAYFANNTVPSSELPTLVDGTRKALLGDLAASTAAPVAVEAPVAPAIPAAVGEPAAEASPAASPPPEYVPAVSIEESLASPDHLISLVDGKPYKTLKRHLATHGLTPAEYRARYGLAKDYPMTSTSYSEARRAVAKAVGLGSRRTTAAEVTPAPDPVPAPEIEAAPVNAAPVKAGAKARATTKPSVSKKAKASAPVKKPAAAKPATAKPTGKPQKAKAAPVKAEVAAAPVEVVSAPKRRRAKANGAVTDVQAKATPSS